jgi:hypothetical protein
MKQTFKATVNLYSANLCGCQKPDCQKHPVRLSCKPEIEPFDDLIMRVKLRDVVTKTYDAESDGYLMTHDPSYELLCTGPKYCDAREAADIKAAIGGGISEMFDELAIVYKNIKSIAPPK